MPIAEKKIRTATAVTISGTISGSVISPSETVLPRKLPPLASTRAPMVAIAVAKTVATVATISEFQTAFWISELLKAFRYQSMPNPPQFITMRLALNE